MGIELVKKSGSLTVAAPPVESLEEIYKQGQASMVDESKIIEATAQGKGSVALNDVSEIPHNITIELSKTMYGKNLSPIGAIQFTQVAQKLPLCGWSETIPAGTYTFSAVITSTETSGNRCAVGFYDEAEQQVSTVWLLPNTNKRAYSAVVLDKPARYLYLYADSSWSAAVGKTATFEDIQLEFGSVATEYEPYIEPYTTTEGVGDVSVYGKNFLHTKTNHTYTASGITAVYNADGSITLKAGVSTNTVVFNFAPHVADFGSFRLPTGTYILSLGNGVDTKVILVLGIKRDGKTTYYENDVASLRVVNIKDTDDLSLYLQIKPNITFTEDLTVYPQLELGTVATAYEQYREPITVANGTVKSISPNMSFTADSGVDIKVSYRKSWGMDEEWSRFWDSYQDYGKRTVYSQAFYSTGWNNKTFKPKYDLIVTGNAYCMFGYSGVTEIPFIDLTGTTSLAQIFYYSSKLKTIKLIKVTKNNLFVNTSFTSCSALENITFEGEIAGNLDFHYSPNLTKASMLNILNHLCDYSTTGETHNLYFGQGLMKNLTEAEKAIATQKGWTIF